MSISSQGLQEDPASPGGPFIKTGSGAVYLDAGNSYTGTTIVSNGVLAGVGSIAGPVVVGPNGILGAGDAGGMGVLTVSGSLTVQGAVAMRISKTGGTPGSDLISGIATANYGGTLVVSNVTSDATALVAGDVFTLFSAGSHTGNFATIAGSPGAGLAYQFNSTSGVLSVITQTYANNPTNITASVNGNVLTLSWPADHTGWILQAQTNSLGSGLSPVAGNWFDVTGSDANNTNVININSANPTVFYRIRKP